MAIVTQQEPAARALIGSGQTQYIFYGDDRLTSAGVVAVNRLSLFSVGAGDQIRLVWAGQELILTGRANPSGPYEIPLGTSGVGNTAYLNQVLPYLRDLYAIREAFTVDIELSDFLGFTLTARRPGPQYNLTAQTSLLRHVVGNLTPGRSAGIRPRYSVHVALRVQLPDTTGENADTDYETVYTTPIETGEDGRAELDVAPLLDGYLTTSYPLTTPRLEQHRAYYVEYAEAYGDPLQVGRVTRTDIRHIYRGGASLARQSGSGFSLDGWVRPADRLDYALRLGPTRRYIAPDSVQFLSFLNPGATLGVSLLVTLSWADGFAQERTELVAPRPWPASGVLTYAVGPVALDLAQVDPGRTLSGYSVRLINTATRQPITEAYTYTLDYAYRPYARQLAYVNSLGAVDVLTTWGKGSEELAYFAQQAQRALIHPYAAEEGEFQVYEAHLQDRLSLTTGYRPKTELAHWKDFYRSREKWLIRRPLTPLAADALMPMGLVSGSIQQGKDGDNLHAHAFELIALRQEHYYSPEDDAQQEPLPPRQFAPAGSVTVNQVTVLQARDPTISDAARNLTQGDLITLNQLKAQGDINQKGFLKQAIGDQLYRAKEDPIPVTQIADLNETVYTRSEIDDQQLTLQRTLVSQVRIRVRAVPATSLPQ
ncbi:hypothetical protein [Fibrella aquatica]|uniref:hypothetical protein n=1 Tax=Fibrella aquatica TaxID=3242487 RepID=UPI00351FC437